MGTLLERHGGKMEMKQEPRGIAMRSVRFWHENQVVITYVSRLDSSEGRQRILESLRLNDLNKTLNTGTGNYNLRSFDEKHVPHLRSSDEDRGNRLENSDLNSPIGKYLFSLPPGQGTLVISFFHVERLNQPDSIKADSTPNLVKLLT